jgi:hypothetical protein
VPIWLLKKNSTGIVASPCAGCASLAPRRSKRVDRVCAAGLVSEHVASRLVAGAAPCSRGLPLDDREAPAPSRGAGSG